MLRNNEKMVVISTTSNEWTQQKNYINDHNMSSIVTTTPQQSKLMDHKLITTFSHQEQQNQVQQKQEQNNNNQEPMRCPRCDSSNTKFCYYNNYSLSQPRHFCKACKRYWTRGGTLRNVPVGGGCRKNKRVKRPHNHLSNHPSSDNLRKTSINSLSIPARVSAGGGDGDGDGSGNFRDTLFYGLPTNHHNLMNFPFSPQINGLGLGFSSGLVHNINVDGINHYNKQIFQDFISSNPTLSNYSNTTTTATTTPSISSILASTFHMKGGGGGGGEGNNFETLLPSYEEEEGVFSKDVKMEIEGQNRSLDYQWSAASQNHMDQSDNIGSPSCDPSIIWGSGPNLGAWLDSSTNNNLTSSIPSLI